MAIAGLEGADGALLFASGMAAITSSILALLKAGDHIVAQQEIYGGTAKFLTQWLPKLGVETTFVDTTQYEQYERAIRPTRSCCISNRLPIRRCKSSILHKAVAVAGKHKLITMIDSTLATPINQRPVEFGVDLVMHSGTKYFSGHCDLICGIIAGRGDLIEKIHSRHARPGRHMDPARCLAAVAGNENVGRQNGTAQSKCSADRSVSGRTRQGAGAFIIRLRKVIRSVHLAREQMRGGGGLLSFEVDGTGQDARRLTESLQLVPPGAQSWRRGIAGVSPRAHFTRHDFGGARGKRWA